MKKTKFFKSLLVAAGLCVGASAWAASALTASLEVTGYEKSHFFDFVNRDFDGTSYTSNDDLPGLGVTAQATIQEAYAANTWYYYNGLRNQCGGGRWISFPAEIKADDYIIINGAAASEAYEISMTDGTSTTVSGASDYLCFKANKAMSALKLTVHRYNYISQILIMTKDESVQTADYTINYVYGENTIKTTTGNDVIGSTVNAESSIWVDNVKYLLDDEQTTSMTIASGVNTLNVNVIVAPTYNYTVVASDGTSIIKELASGSVYAGESATIAYPQYVISENVLYNIAANGSGDWYRYSITPTKDGDEFTLTYNNGSAIEDVVFYTEAEDISGTTSGDNTARASVGKMGHTANSNTYVNATTLAVGKYKIYWRGVNGNSAARTANYKVGNRVVYTCSIPNGTNNLGNSDEFVVPESTALLFACDGSSASGTDWFYVQKTGDPTAEEIADAVKADKAARVFNIIGLGNDWDTDHLMTQSSVEGEEDIYTFTTSMNVVGGEADNYFEYKLRQNSDWDGYQLPAADANPQNKSWKDQVNGIGIYTLTFTADVAHHTLECEAVKSDFTYVVVGSKKVDDNNEDSPLFDGNWNTATSTDILAKGADGKFTLTKEVELEAQYVEFKVVAKDGDNVLKWFGNGTYTDGVEKNANYNFTSDGTYYVTFTFDGSTVYATAEQKHAWTVAGNNTTLFGTTWAADASANDMTRNAEGIWTITYENKTLTAGTIEYKIVQDHNWKLPNYGYNGNNATAMIPADGEYNVTFTFNASTTETGCVIVPTSVSKTITDAGYATYCSPYALDFTGSALTAYVAAKDVNNKVTFSTITKVPANTGILLKGAAGDYTINTTTGDTDPVTDNALVGVLVDTEVPAGSFVLLKGTSGVGFYSALNAFTVSANTAYIEALPTTARFIGFNLDESTGIDGIAVEKMNNGEVYNLQGQRVTKAQKGLYIINGKKVLVK
ncbi:MAG: hypothetical protein IKH32_03395 [Prevotella sp.]|nr:hypothetical protein [Prevotella sp.]